MFFNMVGGWFDLLCTYRIFPLVNASEFYDFLLMRSNICLLILPISDFVGLMRRHVAGVENIADHGTICSRKFFMLTERKKGGKKRGKE